MYWYSVAWFSLSMLVNMTSIRNETSNENNSMSLESFMNAASCTFIYHSVPKLRQVAFPTVNCMKDTKFSEMIPVPCPNTGESVKHRNDFHHID